MIKKIEESAVATHEGRMRGWIKFALEQCKKLLSTKTGLIHGSAERDDDQREIVSIWDNVAYELLLLRTKHIDQINEAKVLIQRILPWQSNEGNFPVYLHDIPVAHDRYFPSKLLPLFFHIAHEFEGVLGGELKQQFRSAAERLLAYAEALLHEKEAIMPLKILLKLACSFVAFGKLWGNKTWQQKGEALLLKIFQQNPKEILLSPQQLGECFLAFSLCYASIQALPWKGFIEIAYGTWDAKRSSYCGPAECLSQWGYEQQIGIYDLFWSLAGSVVPERLWQSNPHFYLQVAWLYPWLSPNEQEPTCISTNQWVCHKKVTHSYSYLSGLTRDDPAKNYSYHPLRLIFGSCELTSSLVCQAPAGTHFTWHETDQGLVGEVVFHKEFAEGDKESTRELIFAWNQREGIVSSVQGQKASLFYLQDPVEIKFPEGILRFKFDVEGEGVFTGHLVPGNRWSQTALKGTDRYQLYDGLLFIRTLHRQPGTKVLVRIEVQL